MFDQADLDGAAEDLLQEFVCECNNNRTSKVNKNRDNCRAQGTKKHDCVNEKIKEHTKTGKDPQLDEERGYNQKGNRMRLGRTEAYRKGRAGGSCWPDACIVPGPGGKGKPTRLCEFKFQCTPGTKRRKYKRKQDGREVWSRAKKNPNWTGAMSPWQKYKYKRLAKQLGLDPKKNPLLIDTTKC